ncbi:HSP18 transcriptional regulator [Lentzea sp. NEAU-D13]|uniref:HSP18 transcriptional regulator n=1 Tax=Lentzea alba TaxID=2714351 RepID=A0A7C9RWU3_9PSEU|nr:HSP18 transcriptional regulator [Lentzea alba]NGY64848.1 HSP18 transcriptional regulator [Lentzea alba]
MTSDYESVRAAAASPGDAREVLAALMLLRELRDELSGWEPQLIEAARALGTSWADLAPALGVASRQAAEKRYLRVRRTGEAGTGDERVQAERDRRAGDKAVAAWARENAGVLRMLAAQVGPHAAAVQQALGSEDAAGLLEPLAEAGPGLRAGHPGLAEQIAQIGMRTDQLRSDAQNRRSG